MRTLIVALSTLLVAAPASAQTLSPEPFTERSIGIEFLRPILDDGDELDVLSFASFIYTRLPIGPVYFLADLPIARVGADAVGTSTGIGNMLLGVEAVRGRASLYGTLRVPTASDDEFANVFALITDFQRWEAWIPDVTTLSLGVIMRDRRASGHGIDFQLGAGFLIPDEGDTEVVLDYGAQYVYRPRVVGFTAGLHGRAGVTGDGDLGERTMHDLRLRLDYTTGRFRPAIGVTLPFDDNVREVLNGVLRLGLQVAI